MVFMDVSLAEDYFGKITDSHAIVIQESYFYNCTTPLIEKSITVFQ